MMPTTSLALSPLHLDRQRARVATAAIAFAVTIIVLLMVHPHSLLQFADYFVAWIALVFLLNRDDVRDFGFAFLVNSCFIAIFVLVQTTEFPHTYGTTSPLAPSWTDDSYFFALAADSIPIDLFVRENYFIYTDSYALAIRALTVFTIDHPLDALFFQSGVAATLATYSKKLATQLSADKRFAEVVFLLTLICPFLMMNGGVLLLRDTLSAALFVYSLTCINAKRYVLAIAAFAAHLIVRPGTALILLPAYAIIYWPELMAFSRRRPLLVMIGVGVCGVVATQLAATLLGLSVATIGAKGVGFFGRGLIADLTFDPNASSLFLAIQQLPFFIKLFVNGAYFFLYPFFAPRYVVDAQAIDLRSIATTVIVPLYGFWLNAWFFAGVITRCRVAARQRSIVVAIIVTVLLIGTYSVQTRHKTIIYPLYYFIVATGFVSSGSLARRYGYVLSGALLLLEIAVAAR